MLKRFFPWKFIVKQAARQYGFIDPLGFLARFRRFSRPSEVQEPLELLRAGILFHARGLINTKAIQHNLDWIWPYWVERQFNPDDSSFIPRAFSFSHVNLTHRNWTAVGLPDLPLYPIVGPRGLVTPMFDGWSVDFWIVPEKGEPLVPSKMDSVVQELCADAALIVKTVDQKDGVRLETSVEMKRAEQGPFLEIRANGSTDNHPASMVMSLRPYNTEGIQFIEKIAFERDTASWTVNERDRVECDTAPDRVVVSNYMEGDVFRSLETETGGDSVECEIGLANAAGVYDVKAGSRREIRFAIPLAEELERQFPGFDMEPQSWNFYLEKTPSLRLPDQRYRWLYDTCRRTLILLSAKKPFPGPYTYRRFWFRDACLMLNALMALNLKEKSRAIIDDFDRRRTMGGYFKSQTGEWDSNGQVLWIMHRYMEISGDPPPRKWLRSAIGGAEWIVRKRRKNMKNSHHPGLLPAGFSAEHFGPNDYYYWDDFWGAGGLRCAASMLERTGDICRAKSLEAESLRFERDIWKSICAIPEKRAEGAIPASPNRRMDAGAVGSLVADYPLRIMRPGNPRIMKTAEFLMENCFHSGGFFQDMIHSGINAYLTLDIAQTLLRAGDRRFFDLVRAVADLASPTGQWPEAIHPITKGGCMGDGQHGWAAAEWIMAVRNMFVREEEDRLILGSGIDPDWLASDGICSFGPTPTPRGDASVEFEAKDGRVFMTVNGDWRRQPPQIEAAVPGFLHAVATGDVEAVELERMEH